MPFVNLLDPLVKPACRPALPERIGLGLGLVHRRNTHGCGFAPGPLTAAGDLVPRLPPGVPSDLVEQSNRPLSLKLPSVLR